jgi:hypothetical protein
MFSFLANFGVVFAVLTVGTLLLGVSSQTLFPVPVGCSCGPAAFERRLRFMKHYMDQAKYRNVFRFVSSPDVISFNPSTRKISAVAAGNPVVQKECSIELWEMAKREYGPHSGPYSTIEKALDEFKTFVEWQDQFSTADWGCAYYCENYNLKRV